MQIVVCRSGTAFIEFGLNVYGLAKIVCVDTEMIFVSTEMISVAAEGTSGGTEGASAGTEARSGVRNSSR